MHLKSLTFQAGGHCVLSFDPTQGWLRATWTGHVNTAEALRGGQHYLQQAGPRHCLYLLNDNGGLRGPWFDSLAWLNKVWLRQAQLLGLRYVAHMVQVDTHSDILTLRQVPTQLGELELRFFDEVASAEDWLRCCQQPLLVGLRCVPFTVKTGPVGVTIPEPSRLRNLIKQDGKAN